MPEEEKDSIQIPTVRTFEQDVAESMQAKHATVLNVAMAEKERALSTDYLEEQRPQSKKEGSRMLVYILSFLFILGSVGAIYVGFFYNKPTDAVIPEDLAPKQELIESSETVAVPVDLQDTSKSLALLSDTSSINNVLGTITRIIPYVSETKNEVTTKREIAAREFFTFLGSNVPDIFMRALEDDFSFVRVSDGGVQGVLILKTVDYERTIVGLTSWEKSMLDDLEKLFGYSRRVEIKERVETITEVEAEEKAQQYDPKTKKMVTITKKVMKPVSTFEDVISYVPDQVSFSNVIRKNIELRVAKGTSQKEYIVYGFPERNTLIIASNTDAFLRVVDKLRNTN